MDQLNRRTKLLILGRACLLLIIGIIVPVLSYFANKKQEPAGRN